MEIPKLSGYVENEIQKKNYLRKIWNILNIIRKKYEFLENFLSNVKRKF
ncbi:MAG: hypothetical protein Satyrvirus11_11 [Satyrvirus sp.]|uniref:Uncharacterized protein n=1 Tax=Satyrvirus sp. TaxID=2487771 RepID=A0A3G5AIT2_9VIRU|nr:MAG: hypothetical protein Satyrvirus11_11 [Satyrvirus sp.]